MNRTVARALLVAGLLPVLGIIPACADDGESFFIVHNQVPVAEGDHCVITAQRGDTIYRGEGRLDLSLVGGADASAYQFYPLLQSDFPHAGAGGRELNRIALRGFRVAVELGAAPPEAAAALFSELGANEAGRILVEYKQPWSGTADPGGRVAAEVTVVPGELARRLRAVRPLEKDPHFFLVARVQAYGERAGEEILSREFRYPIRVCQGCLAAVAGACPIKAVNLGNACGLLQDDPIDCCTAGSALRCGSAASLATAPAGQN